MKMGKQITCFVVCAVVIASWVLGQRAVTGQVDTKALFEEKCGICHSTDRPKLKKKTAAEWATTVERMRGKGASLTDEEATVIVDHLAQHYGK
jgi:cytochrome c5